MKTKSKRFLNLATLCLALLGTALLMAHPVKAEVMSKEEYMTRFWFWEGGSDEYPAQLEARYKGYVEGYNKGLEGHDRPKWPEIEVPKDVDPSDYRDGYEEGFGEGKHKRHPSETEVEDDSQGGRQDSVGSSSQQEDTDMISPVIQTVIQTVFGVFSSFLNWLEAAI
ncbi:hypothetical membrane associated protein [Streptococcus pyogenes]|uniref:hypothetical protein n=1 Tax=Streptococcus pyogenes TaxID=1314 RepID=UPI0010A13221|nr:hypothetical protein [Streptococcus pyogenes]QCK70425.1 hypothetical protein ETT46_02185 [Streptococcus pyogenes]VGR76241.1 hypothetical membrane associated protein [Streptococcus pyogenes]VGS01373.1 hypothetical membrane associated protein [Streptococcus pyogenes]VGS43127.1 hypothetical membrane associated protein [Streptococcus pyogenes]VGX18226.1 Uncharacterised protein [Streptococcus pyogenes]